jgi:RHS repeat-associated protein
VPDPANPGSGALVAQTTDYLVDSSFAFAQTLEEVQSSGAGQSTRTLYTLDDSGALVGSSRDDGSSNGPSQRYYEQDGLGSVTAVSDASGTLSQSYRYSAFGQVHGATADDNNAYRYAGEYEEVTTGLQYNRDRWYDPEIGRFLSMDPAIGNHGQPLSLNRYLYVLNDPVNNIDPGGQETMIGLMTGLAVMSELLIRAIPRVPGMGVATCGAEIAVGMLEGALVGAALASVLSPTMLSFVGASFAVLSAPLIANDLVLAVQTKDKNGKPLNPSERICRGLQAIADLAPFFGSRLARPRGPREHFRPEEPEPQEHEPTAPACSFAVGTTVSTPDGDKAIESLHVGDLVYSRNDKTGEVDAKPILHVFVEQHTDDIRVLTVEDASGKDTVIITSDLHPFHTATGWVAAGLLNVGSRVDTLDGKIVVVVGSQHKVDPQSMFNFEIADFHTFSVSGEKVWVHNANCGLDWSLVSNKGETRQDHVGEHGDNNLQKREQGVFNGDPVATTNDAWRIAQETGIQPIPSGNGVDIYVVPYPDAGYMGGYGGQGQTLDNVTIMTKSGTNELITAFPGNGSPKVSH